ncbi:MAG: hypothetical protein K2X38_01365 [Gemmataceae bacterium]|nr:hypothetical protein [Gemmataceae bacterium]
MQPAGDWDYRRSGTAENILVRAGLVTATLADDGIRVEAGTGLASLFAPASPPALELVLPHLLDLVFAEAFDRSGFLASGDIRLHAVGMLQQAGMKISSAGVLTERIRKAADESKADLIKQQSARR